MISPEYKLQQQQMHSENKNYGTASAFYFKVVMQMMKLVNAREMLDYGAGKCLFGSMLQQQGWDGNYFPYDPGIDGIDDTPDPAEFVSCIDVLEHVEPEHLDNVLDDLKRLTLKHGFFSVSSRPAKKTLPDGRNAHLIQEPIEWWLPKIMERFTVLRFEQEPDKQSFFFFVRKK